MHLVVDIETDALELEDVKNIWLVVAKDIETEKVYSYKGLTDECKSLLNSATSIIGHNFICYDYCVIERFAPGTIDPRRVVDTLVLSRLLKFKPSDEQGQSLEAWGARFNIPKHPSPDFSRYSPAMLEYCKQDVEINYQLYLYLYEHLSEAHWQQAIQTEMEMAWICLDMHKNGFKYDKAKADVLEAELESRLAALDEEIVRCFPPKLVPIREITPRLTKHGTISKANLPRDWVDLTAITADCPFTLVKSERFNPGSSSQIVERLLHAGWRPVERTKTGKSFKINEVNLATLPETAPEGARKLVERLLIAARVRTLKEWSKCCHTEIRIEKESIEKLGRGIREELILNGEIANRTIIIQEEERRIWKQLVKSIDTKDIHILKKDEDLGNIYSTSIKCLLRTLTNWLKSKKVDVRYVEENENYVSITIIPQEKLEDFFADNVIRCLDGLKIIGIISNVSYRIRGRFNSIGTWPGRMSHNSPNMGNVSARKSIKYKGEHLRRMATNLGASMRSLWVCDTDSWLVGTDMEAAHVRLFAHYIDDKEFTNAVISGDKKFGTDVHSLGAKLFKHLGCDRDNHKTFIFSFFNGAGPPKVAEIFGCSIGDASKALRLYQERYPGLSKLRTELIPGYAHQGWFPGLDGRKVIYNEEHGMFAGMLQSGESIVMKMANIMWRKKLDEAGILYKQVNLVHDEYVTEVLGSKASAELAGQIQADSIRCVGRVLGLRCPLGGEYKVGRDWLAVH